MIEDERPKEVYPQTINVRIIEYIDRTIKTVIEKIESKCDTWRLELSGLRLELTSLRAEWRLEHQNLIQRFETFVSQYNENNISIDKHFERINELQSRMDKLSTAFMTADQVDTKIQLALAGQQRYFALLVIIIVAALSVIGYSLGIR
jgi:chromosome segregation ATPase